MKLTVCCVCKWPQCFNTTSFSKASLEQKAFCLCQRGEFLPRVHRRFWVEVFITQQSRKLESTLSANLIQSESGDAAEWSGDY